MRRADFGFREIAIVALVAVILLIMTLLFISLINPTAFSSVSFGERVREVFE